MLVMMPSFVCHVLVMFVDCRHKLSLLARWGCHCSPFETSQTDTVAALVVFVFVSSLRNTEPKRKNPKGWSYILGHLQNTHFGVMRLNLLLLLILMGPFWFGDFFFFSGSRSFRHTTWSCTEKKTHLGRGNGRKNCDDNETFASWCSRAKRLQLVIVQNYNFNIPRVFSLLTSAPPPTSRLLFVAFALSFQVSDDAPYIILHLRDFGLSDRRENEADRLHIV